MELKASIVIPVYNREAYIGRAIRSVLTQTLQEFEIVVIDGHSTDNTEKIVKSFCDSRIRFTLQDGYGVSAARNQAVDLAKSDFIAFLDADDEWLPTHLETLIRLRDSYPEAGLYATAYVMCKPNGNYCSLKVKSLPPSPWEGLIPNYFKTVCLGSYPVLTSTVGLSKKIFIQMGGFPIGENSGEDLDLWGKIGLRYPIAFSWSIGGIYHTEADNRIGKQGAIRDDLPFIKTASLFLEENGNSEISECLIEYIEFLKITIAHHNLKYGHKKHARKTLLNCNTKYHKHRKYFYLTMTYMPDAVIYFPLLKI